MEIFASSDVDVFVPPQQSSISQILTLIRGVQVSQVYTLSRGVSEVVSFEVMPEMAMALVGKSVSAIGLPEGVVFCALCRGDDVFFGKDVVIATEDSLVFLLQDKNKFPALDALFV